MDFQSRLRKAVERGQHAKDVRAREKADRALDEEQCKRWHSEYRLELSEHIESCVRQLADQFPGFQIETIVGDRGWGAAAVRDDIEIRPGGKRTNYYSRLEIAVRPYTKYHVLDLAVKGTIRNKEEISQNHFELLTEADLDGFRGLVDQLVLRYAELYATRT